MNNTGNLNDILRLLNRQAKTLVMFFSRAEFKRVLNEFLNKYIFLCVCVCIKFIFKKC